MKTREVLSRLAELGRASDPGYLESYSRAGINTSNALGIPVPDLRRLAKEIGKDHGLALELWASDLHEAKLLAPLIDEADSVTEDQMERWAADFHSWDVCDQCCSNLFDRTGHCQKKIREWVGSDKEFVRRAGFVLMATSAVHDKKAPDERFVQYLPLVKKYSYDSRNFVKKGINWALRQIGKRNIRLHGKALKVAKELMASDDKTKRWVGSVAVKELEKKEITERIRRRR